MAALKWTPPIIVETEKRHVNKDWPKITCYTQKSMVQVKPQETARPLLSSKEHVKLTYSNLLISR